MRADIYDVVAGLGLAVIVFGVSLWSTTAAFIAAGVCAVCFGLVGSAASRHPLAVRKRDGGD